MGSRIREARKAARLTQQQLADLVGVTDAAVSSWETGRYQPTVTNYKKISRVTGVSLIELMGDAT